MNKEENAVLNSEIIEKATELRDKLEDCEENGGSWSYLIRMFGHAETFIRFIEASEYENLLKPIDWSLEKSPYQALVDLHEGLNVFLESRHVSQLISVVDETRPWCTDRPKERYQTAVYGMKSCRHDWEYIPYRNDSETLVQTYLCAFRCGAYKDGDGNIVE